MKSTPIFRQSLTWGALASLVIAVIGGGIGFLVDGTVGLGSALLGTALALVFLSITAGSILFANRFFGSDLYVPIFFGVVLGGWIVKFVLFLVFALVLKDQPWINPLVLFLSIIAGVLATLVLDVVIVSRSRMLYASDVILPGEENGSN
jgi:hypothetical protein